LKEGEIIYQGETYHAIYEYFPINFEKFQLYQNPFDYILEIIDKFNLDILREKYRKKIGSNILSEINFYNQQYNCESNRIHELEQTRTVTMSIEIKTLMSRNIRNYFRNKSVFYSRLFQFLSHTILIILFYMNLNNKHQLSHLTNFVGFCYNCVNIFFSFGMYSTISTIFQYKKVFTKEYPSKLYRLSSFFISTLLFLLIQSVLYSCIFTFLVTMTIMNLDIMQFHCFFIYNLVDYMIGASYGNLLGMSLDESRIYSVAPFVFILSMLGSGVLRNNFSFPYLLKIVNYWSHYRYLLELHFENEGDKKINRIMNYEFGNVNCIVVVVVLLVIINILSFFSLKRYAKRLKL
jgi:hypothetical protein